MMMQRRGRRHSGRAASGARRIVRLVLNVLCVIPITLALALGEHDGPMCLIVWVRERERERVILQNYSTHCELKNVTHSGSVERRGKTRKNAHTLPTTLLLLLYPLFHSLQRRAPEAGRGSRWLPSSAPPEHPEAEKRRNAEAAEADYCMTWYDVQCMHACMHACAHVSGERT